MEEWRERGERGEGWVGMGRDGECESERVRVRE